jgi:selenocysteine lyase/cysteine desulfurase
MVPLVLGADHERGLRPGTENVAAIVGLGMACEIAGSDMATVAARVAALRDDLLQRLEAGVPGVMLNGHRTLRLPNTLNVRFPRVSGNAILAGAPEIAASTGSACHARSWHDCRRHCDDGQCAGSILAQRLSCVTPGRAAASRPKSRSSRRSVRAGCARIRRSGHG